MAWCRLAVAVGTLELAATQLCGAAFLATLDGVGDRAVAGLLRLPRDARSVLLAQHHVIAVRAAFQARVRLQRLDAADRTTLACLAENLSQRHATLSFG